MPGHKAGHFTCLIRLPLACLSAVRLRLSGLERILIMNGKSVLLSISMLISGKKDMVKSLESLRFFREAFPCELILVDTGCSREQRAAAEQYADKIVDFVWCNDFAAARNAGLKEAHGEWFMYLDDDEWFDDPQEIIAFFRTGEYKKYNCASYAVRNYSDFQGMMYDDSYPSRMVKLEPGTKFTGKIHEYLEPFKLPKKTFSDFVHHYGYVYKDEEEKRKHARRNIGPLHEMREQHPGDPRWMCQLAQEYFAIQEYEEVIKVCEAGLEEWKALKDYVEYAPSHVGAVYGYILISLESMEAYEEEETWLGKALADPITKLKFMRPTVAFYCLVAARLYHNLGKHDLCREYLRRYLDYYRELKDDRTLIEAGTAAIIEGVFQEQLLYGVILMSMESVIRMEDDALAGEAFFEMNWADSRLLHQNRWEKAMLDACCSVEYRPMWVKIMQTLVARESGMKEMLVVFLETEISYKRQGESEKLSRLRRLVSELDYEHRYVLCMRILWTAQNPDIGSEETRRQRAGELFRQLFEKYADEILEVKTEVWNVAEKLEIPIEPLLLQTDCRRWQLQLEQWSQNAAAAELQQWDNRIARWKRQPDIRYDLFTVKCLEGYLCHFQELCSDLTQLEQLLWKYADSVLVLYRLYYKETVFGEIPEVQHEGAQLALNLKELQQYRESGDDRKALESMRKCLGVYPALEPVLGAYAKLYRDEVQKRTKEATEAQSELRYLVVALKKKAGQQIEQGEYQAAKEILLQVQQCAPDDGEVTELLEGIEQNG